MGLYQPTVIAPSSLNGTGVIDATQDMKVTWQINGTIPITGWQFVIMENTVASTVKYTSAWRHDYLDPSATPPIIKYTYGRDENGNPLPKTDTISAADLASAGIVNNFAPGYKLKVNQQYSIYENPNTSNVATPKTLEMISPVFFLAMESANFASLWASSFGRWAYFGKSVSSTATHIPHVEFDPLLYQRWRLAEKNDPDNHILEDTGNEYLANDEQKLYGMMKNGGEYAVRLTGQLESGLEMDTGWHDFSCSWTDTAQTYIHLVPYYVTDNPCIYLRFEADEGHDLTDVTSPAAGRGWEVYRIRTDNGEMSKVGVIPRGKTDIYDFGARNNTEYIYRAYYGLGAANGNCYETERAVRLHYYWNWAIIECEKRETRYQYLTDHYYTNTMYHVTRIFQFQGNVESGQVTNENSPFVENNFTPYPTVQKSTRKALTGTLRAWMGKTRNGVFRDSIRQIDRLMELGTRETVKFIKDRKGNLRQIEVSDPIKKTTQDPYGEQPVQVEVPWVEVADAKNLQIVSMAEDGLMAPGDDIVDTVTLRGTGSRNGYIRWRYNDTDYLGSSISMDENGMLVQTYDDSMTYVPAELSIVDGNLAGTTAIDAEED